VGKVKTGLASWYAFTGKMACASRMFPRGTWLRVTSKATGKQIFVVVNDYGPQKWTGKMIDLDKVAFEKLASLGAGVIEVKVEEILD
jgi:rare lipoprotein A (peptidoglycan hydrolase)